MKICFISFTNIYLTPYIKNYISNINGPFDVIVWNRHNIEEYLPNGSFFSFNTVTEDNSNKKITKLENYFKFSKYVTRIIKQNHYDVLILLQAIGAVFLYYPLLKYYKRKFIIDIRDYSIEGYLPLYLLEKQLLSKSIINVISSNGYREFLSKNEKYLLVHNYSGIEKKYIRTSLNFKLPIRLGYIGLIRFQDQNRKIINLFANDKRFSISFIGKNACELQKYINDFSISNVKIVDYFPAEHTLDYYNEMDGILNVYGNHQPLLDYALSNKLYYSASLRIPIIVSKDTYMEKIAVGNGFGFVLDFDDINIKDKLIAFYNHLEQNTFFDNCDAFMKQVCIDNQVFDSTIHGVLNEEK